MLEGLAEAGRPLAMANPPDIEGRRAVYKPANIFPKWMNHIPTATAIGGLAALTFVSFGYWYWLHPAFWRVGYMPDQPVDYSHQIHAGQLGMDCRYCHTHVEESYAANIPATSTCMNCHTVVNQTTGLLAKSVSADGTSPSAHWKNTELTRVRAAYDSGKPIEWRRVHKAPDYVQFPHSAHLNAGISCYSCHGRVDEMPVVVHAKDLAMGFCLECHREPEKYLVDTRGLLAQSATGSTFHEPPIRVTDLRAVESQLASVAQEEMGRRLKEKLELHPPQHCGACHY